MPDWRAVLLLLVLVLLLVVRELDDEVDDGKVASANLRSAGV